MTPIVAKALEIAGGQIGVRETGRNRGPEVDGYLIAAGLDPSAGDYPWCCSFAYFCFHQASLALGEPNPMPKTPAVLKAWAKTPFWFRSKAPQAGALFVIDHGGGKGHMGFVEVVSPQLIVTIEGNTNAGGGREGDGVYRRTRRLDEATGYIDYSLPAPKEVA